MDADAEARYREFVAAELGPLLRTAYLLCGSWHTGEDPCRPPSAVGGSRPTVPECTTVLAPARPGGRLSPVSVTQIFGSRPTQRAGPVWGPPTLLQVHRLPAQLRLGHLAGAHAGQPQYTRVLLWTEHGVNVTVSSGPAASPDRLPSAAELLRVADGVRW